VDRKGEYQLSDYKGNVVPNDILFELTKKSINHTRAKSCWGYELLASDYKLNERNCDRFTETDRPSLLNNTTDLPRTTWQVEAQCDAIAMAYWPDFEEFTFTIDYFKPSKSLRYIHWASTRNLEISYSGVKLGRRPELILNMVLLDPSIPDYVVGFILYHELLHFFMQDFSHKHSTEFIAELYDYKWCWDAELWMRDNPAHVLLLQREMNEKNKAGTKDA